MSEPLTHSRSSATRRLLASSFAALALGGPALAAQPASLCAPGEQVLFACPIGPKMVSVCAVAGQPAQYRFGTARRIELKLSGLRFARRMYSGGGESRIEASSGPYRYVVYDRTVRTSFTPNGQNDPQNEAGLAVYRAGKLVSDRPCKAGSNAQISPAAAKLLGE